MTLNFKYNMAVIVGAPSAIPLVTDFQRNLLGQVDVAPVDDSDLMMDQILNHLARIHPVTPPEVLQLSKVTCSEIPNKEIIVYNVPAMEDWSNPIAVIEEEYPIAKVYEDSIEEIYEDPTELPYPMGDLET